MSRPLLGVTIDCLDVVTVARFWREALGFTESTEPDSDVVFHTLFAPDERGLHHVTLQRVPEPKVTKVRVHLDLFVHDVLAEIDRLVALGASIVTAADPSSDWLSAVLADPEGHEFCVAQRSDD